VAAFSEAVCRWNMIGAFHSKRGSTSVAKGGIATNSQGSFLAAYVWYYLCFKLTTSNAQPAKDRTMLPIRELQSKLLRQRRTLLREVAHLEEDLRWLETDAESELVERGQDEVFIRLLARLDDQQKAEIEAIDRAFGKIANGDYGRCETCGKPIPLARLEALPTAATCLPCAEARERLPA
jgi:DnaK suppressor protein